MILFHSKKGKIFFWTYLIISFYTLYWSNNILNSSEQSQIVGSLLLRVYNVSLLLAAHLVVLIPLTYLIVIAFITMRFTQHFAYIKRYQSFYDYPKEKQNEILASQFCSGCKNYQKVNFKDEKMIDGMRWVYAECSVCANQVKVRLT